MSKGPDTTLMGLQDILFEQLEELTNPDLSGEELQNSMRRTKGVVDVSNQIIKNGYLMLAAVKHSDEYGGEERHNMPKALRIGGK